MVASFTSSYTGLLANMCTYKVFPFAGRPFTSLRFVGSSFGLLMVAMLAALPAAAQQASTPQTGPQQANPKADTTPKLEKLEEGEPPSIKIGKPEVKSKVTERGDSGEIKEEQVKSGGSTYYVKPNQQVGNSVPGDAQSSQNHGVQWKVKEFDLGSKKKESDSGSPPAGDSAAPAQK
jgi:hypothetical protein